MSLLIPPPFLCTSRRYSNMPEFIIWTQEWCQWIWAALVYGEIKKEVVEHLFPRSLEERDGLKLGEGSTCMCTPIAFLGFSTVPLSLLGTWACKSWMWGQKGRTDTRGVGEAEAGCKSLWTLDAVKVSDYNPEGECQLPKNPGLGPDVSRCFVSPQ